MLVLPKFPLRTPRAEPAGSNPGLEYRERAEQAGGCDAGPPREPLEDFGERECDGTRSVLGTGKVMEHRAGLKAAPGASTGTGPGTAVHPHSPGSC